MAIIHVLFLYPLSAHSPRNGCCRVLTFDMGKNIRIPTQKNIQFAKLAGSSSKLCVVGGDGCLGGCEC